MSRQTATPLLSSTLQSPSVEEVWALPLEEAPGLGSACGIHLCLEVRSMMRVKHIFIKSCCCLVAKSSPTLCDPRNWSLPDLCPCRTEVFLPGPGKNTVIVVGCHFFLQWIFPTQRSNPGPHYRQTLSLSDTAYLRHRKSLQFPVHPLLQVPLRKTQGPLLGPPFHGKS